MTLFGALIISVFIAILITENYGYGYWMISRPIFAGPLIGLIMGDLQTGLFVGATVELMYMGILPIGGSVPPNAQIAGIISTVFAINNGGNAELGIALAFPIGMLAQLLIMFAWNVNIILIHGADNALKAGKVKRAERIHLSGLIVFFFVFFIPTFLAIYFGSDAVNTLVQNMPSILLDGLKISAGILPAVGMAMLLKMMNFKKFWPYFMIAFVLAVYLNLSVLAISMLGFGLAAAIYINNAEKAKQASDGFDDFDEVDEDAIVDEQAGILTKKELRQTFFRSFFGMTSINYERYQSLGFCYAMIPALRKLYPNHDEFIEATSRHNEFFNCHPYTGNAVIGVTLALEEQRAMGKPITTESISAAKAALMGPLSGIGDSVFKASFMTVFATIAAGMALEGNPIAPLVFIVPNVLLNVGSRWYFIQYGHQMGTNLISKMKTLNLFDEFVNASTIVGMMVVGAMVVSFVKLTVVLNFTVAGNQIIVDDLINSIFPKLLPLTIVLVYYQIIKNNKKGMYIVVATSFAIGIIGRWLGIL